MTKKHVIALGNFDGVHIGHQKLLETTVTESIKLNAVPAVWSLKYENRQYITTIPEKVELLKSFGIQTAIFEEFKNVCEYSPERFVKEILIDKFNCVTAVCGFNFRFGQNRSGTADTLRSLINCIIISPVTYNDEIISSTLIRSVITNGDMEHVREILGHPYSVKNTVIAGKRLGHKIGVPTANQTFPEGQIIPAYGVYCTRCTIDNITYDCVTNVGVKPTVAILNQVICETHIIGYNGILYDSVLKIDFYKYLRSEKKFDSLDELKQAIDCDIKKAEEYFKND
ncbi:MAG: bifunctional riboflavin kinase/FAD synthetase [Oscillospiraceae bacterium]|nr:bifunctional riboflavin kinase/FAD synthetase [Oscillospiraceae bacterium]